MDGGGYIKLWRKMLHNPIMQHDGLCRLWLYCLLKAEWKDREALIPGTTDAVKVERGTFVTTRSRLHAELYPKDDDREMPSPAPYTLWRWLMSLEKMGCVKLENMCNRGSLITICNYETYQNSETNSVPPVSSRRAAGEQPVSSREFATLEEEEGKKEKRGAKSTFEIQIPAPLDTPAFGRSWSEWLDYRRQCRTSMRPETLNRQLVMLASLGEATAIECIESSIRNGWKGLFPQKDAKPTTSTGPRVLTDEEIANLKA